MPTIRKDKIEYITYLTIVDYIKAHKQSIIAEFLRQAEANDDKVRENELRKKVEIQKNKAKKLLALYDGRDDLILDAYKDAKRTLDLMEVELASFVQSDNTSIDKEILEVFIDSFLMETGHSDVYLKNFFTSLDVKVVVNKINAEIQLNLSVLPFVVALKVYLSVAKLREREFLGFKRQKSLVGRLILA